MLSTRSVKKGHNTVPEIFRFAKKSKCTKSFKWLPIHLKYTYKNNYKKINIGFLSDNNMLFHNAPVTIL